MWKILFIVEILEVEKGNLDEMDRGKNNLLGILSLAATKQDTCSGRSHIVDKNNEVP